jgi:hypothetical protein
MKELGHTHIDILKIDVEGSEYVFLEQMLDTMGYSYYRESLEYLRPAYYGHSHSLHICPNRGRPCREHSGYLECLKGVLLWTKSHWNGITSTLTCAMELVPRLPSTLSAPVPSASPDAADFPLHVSPAPWQCSGPVGSSSFGTTLRAAGPPMFTSQLLVLPSCTPQSESLTCRPPAPRYAFMGFTDVRYNIVSFMKDHSKEPRGTGGSWRV